MNDQIIVFCSIDCCLIWTHTWRLSHSCCREWRPPLSSFWAWVKTQMISRLYVNHVTWPDETLGPSYSQLYSTYQLISGTFHLLTPLYRAVELVLVQDLLLDGGCVLTPRGRLDQTLHTDRHTGEIQLTLPQRHCETACHQKINYIIITE